MYSLHRLSASSFIPCKPEPCERREALRHGLSFSTPVVGSARWAIRGSFSTSHACIVSTEGLPEPRLARRARMKRGYWNDPENMTRELRNFAVAQGDPNRMPTESELRKGNRVDIASAVRRFGGWERAASEAGLVLTSIARPRSIYLTFCIDLKPGAILKPHNYWNEFSNLRDELMKFVEQRDSNSSRRNATKSIAVPSALNRRLLPSTAELELARRSDLVRAIHKHGGFENVARRLDLRFRYHSGGYWRKFENVEKEIRLLTALFGAPTEMPPLKALSHYGPPGLRHAVSQIHGGKHAVADRMGLGNKHLPRGHWCSAENREKSVREFIRKLEAGPIRQDSNTLPVKRAMIAAGRAELAQALERHGGFRAHALSYGLHYKGKAPRRNKSSSLCSCCRPEAC